MKRMPVILLTALALLSCACLPVVHGTILAYAEDASPTLEALLTQRAEIDKVIALVKEDEIIEGAINALVFSWEEEYLKYLPPDKSGHLEIKWSRVVYIKDGTFEVLRQDPIAQYRARTYQTDYSHIIDSISDRESDFNRVFSLNGNQAAE